MISSVYIHIPFCHNICTYCSFTKFYYNQDMVKKYLISLKEEVLKRYKGEEIKTIYVGGGTPNVLTITELEELFKIIAIFKLSNDYEFTFEVNPECLDYEKIKFLKQHKVNRISMGVERVNSKFLKYLGREHNFNLVKERIQEIKDIGILNINVDFIYALKNETLKDLDKELDLLLSLDVPHISTYSLMIEEHTKLYIDKTLEIDSDLDYLMYDLIRKKLISKGFKHYEISNFAKSSYESRHNLVYWNNMEYYGFGLSAASYVGNKRFTNTSNLNKYINGNYIKETETLSKKDKISYALILGFRKIEGINIQEFNKKYNVNLLELYNIKELIKNKNLIIQDGNLRISYDKIYVSNNILVNFVGE